MSDVPRLHRGMSAREIETDRIIWAAGGDVPFASPVADAAQDLRQVLADRGKLAQAAKLLGLAKRTGIISLAKLLKYFPWFQGLAEAPDRLRRGPSCATAFPIAADPNLKPISYFAGCAIEYMLPEVGEATEQVLRAAGYRMELADNVCCGLPPYAYGDLVVGRAPGGAQPERLSRRRGDTHRLRELRLVPERVPAALRGGDARTLPGRDLLAPDT